MARNRERRKVIYDNDATVVTETAGVVDDASVVQRKSPRMNQRGPVNISVVDVLDTFASFLHHNYNINLERVDEKECVICGKAIETPIRIRHICADCMKKYAEEMRNLSRNAIENGETGITLNV